MNSEIIKEHARGKMVRFMNSCKNWCKKADHDDDDGRRRDMPAAENNNLDGDNGTNTTLTPDGDDGTRAESADAKNERDRIVTGTSTTTQQRAYTVG